MKWIVSAERKNENESAQDLYSSLEKICVIGSLLKDLDVTLIIFPFSGSHLVICISNNKPDSDIRSTGLSQAWLPHNCWNSGRVNISLLN